MAEDDEGQVIDFDIAWVENKLGDWQSFWDVCNPDRAAQMLFEHFGGDVAGKTLAVREAAFLALHAEDDNRPDDFRFWQTVFRLLSGTSSDKESPTPDDDPKSER